MQYCHYPAIGIFFSFFLLNFYLFFAKFIFLGIDYAPLCIFILIVVLQLHIEIFLPFAPSIWSPGCYVSYDHSGNVQCDYAPIWHVWKMPSVQKVCMCLRSYSRKSYLEDSQLGKLKNDLKFKLLFLGHIYSSVPLYLRN